MSEIYIAGKINHKEDMIKGFAEELEERGHHITLKWWEDEALEKPYLENDRSWYEALAMEQAVRVSDALVLFPEDNILGAAIELGIAIGDTTKPDREIVIVNPFERRQSIFYAHPAVVCVDGLTKVRERQWY